MADSTTDPWQMIFFGGAALLIALQTLRGWHLGVVRQTLQVLAIVGAYVAAWFGAPYVAPYLQPLGFPNFLLTVIAGAGVGLLVYYMVSVGSAFRFKRTAEQSAGAARFGYGAAGAFVGMVFGLFMVFALAVAIRLLGSVAEAEVQAAGYRQASGRARTIHQSNGEARDWVRSLAGMKRSVESGPAGAVVQQLDPIPGTLYSIVQKVGVMASREESLQRFITFPGVQPITEHPRVTALVNDPQIVRDVAKHDFLALLRNPKVIAAANDPEIASLMRELEFEKALDYALGKPEKPDSAPPMR